MRDVIQHHYLVLVLSGSFINYFTKWIMIFLKYHYFNINCSDRKLTQGQKAQRWQPIWSKDIALKSDFTFRKSPRIIVPVFLAAFHHYPMIRFRKRGNKGWVSKQPIGERKIPDLCGEGNVVLIQPPTMIPKRSKVISRFKNIE